MLRPNIITDNYWKNGMVNSGKPLNDGGKTAIMETDQTENSLWKRRTDDIHNCTLL
jgi:hypothetical protein